MSETAHAGGSFAPPIDAAKVESYRKLAESADPQVGDAMGKLLDMIELYLDAPAPKKAAKAKADAGKPHPSGLGTIFAMPKEEVERLWDVVPWQDETNMYLAVFDRIDPVKDKALRDAAFHLGWFAVELGKDRVPITTDKL
jgi:hypothetical protein